jgi:Ricin-type beta-trefoil lectin domain
MKHRATGLCIDANGSGLSNDFILHECNGSDFQKFRVSDFKMQSPVKKDPVASAEIGTRITSGNPNPPVDDVSFVYTPFGTIENTNRNNCWDSNGILGSTISKFMTVTECQNSNENQLFDITTS